MGFQFSPEARFLVQTRRIVAAGDEIGAGDPGYKDDDKIYRSQDRMLGICINKVKCTSVGEVTSPKSVCTGG